jgi:hypothetical protein
MTALVDTSSTAHAAKSPSLETPQGHAENGRQQRTAKGKDEAMEMVGEEEHAVDPAVAARALRKIDLFLIPAMIVGCT